MLKNNTDVDAWQKKAEKRLKELLQNGPIQMRGDQKMLSSFTVKNFKSYIEATLPLSTVTFLIGANGSGKSNALEALRFVGWLGQGKRLDDIERDINKQDTLLRGKPTELFRKGYNSFDLIFQVERHYVLDLEIQNRKNHLIILHENLKEGDRNVPMYQIVSEPSDFSDEITVAYDNYSKGPNKKMLPCSNRQAVFYQLISPSRFNVEQSKRRIPPVTQKLKDIFANIIFLDPQPSRMRDYAQSGEDIKISEDGGNVSAVLQQICKDQTNKKKLLDFICSLPEQNIKDITFEETRIGAVLLYLSESFGDSDAVAAPLLSDGTLRVLAIAAALLGAPENALVVIEEIDNGIHPSRAKYLVDQIYSIAKERHIQLLVTTHNPALMNAVPLEELGSVLCCYRDDQDGSSKIVRLGNLSRFSELATRDSLGNLATSETLESAVKDTTTDRERIEKNLAWLDEFEKDVKGRLEGK